MTEPAAAHRRFFRSSFCYLLGSVFSKIVVFFMLPVYTANIPTTDMGMYDSAVAVSILTASVLFLDIGVGILRFLLPGGEEERRDLLVSGLFLMLASGTVYLLLSLLLFAFYHPPYFFLIVLYGLSNSVLMTMGFVARARGCAAFYAIANSVSTLIQVALNLILILIFRWDYSALYLSFCVGAGLASLLIFFRCRVYDACRYGRVNRADLARLLRFCLPLGANCAAFWLLNSLDRVLVTAVLGTAANGYYAVAVKFTKILIFASACFQFAWQELSFLRGYEKERDERYYTEKTDLFLRIFMAAVLLLIPFVRIWLFLFPGFIDVSYSAAVPLIPLALLGTFVATVCSFLTPLFETTHRNKIIFFATLSGAMVNLLVILILFRFGVGVVAANIAFLCGYCATAVFLLVSLKKTVGLRVRIWRFLPFVPLAVGLSAVFACLPLFYNVLTFLLTAVLCAFSFRREGKALLTAFRVKRGTIHKKSRK